MTIAPSRRTRALRIVFVIGTVFMAVLVGRLWSGGYLGRDPVSHFPAHARPASVQVLFFSGDAGMRFGMGPHLAGVLAGHGIETTAVATSTVFRFRRDRQQLDAIVAGAVAKAEARAKGRRLIVIAQSYGADIAQTGLADLPVPLRKQIAGVILIVPGEGTYFRADPLGLLYRFAPDSLSVETVQRIDWTPLTCIYGQEEDDSLCPLLTLENATVIDLPGGHYLNHDRDRLAATVLRKVTTIGRGK